VPLIFDKKATRCVEVTIARKAKKYQLEPKILHQVMRQ
jgi:hypothetical protein